MAFVDQRRLRSSKPQEQSSHFTIFIRLPFPRGEFVDPPPVQWDSSKDTALWDIISKASNGKEVDWHALAEEFDVTLAFLLQQAAWLYERQLSQVRAQLRKVNRPVSIGTPPMPSSVSGSGYAMTRGGSQGSRVPSSLANRSREQAVTKGDAVSPDAPPQFKGPRISRNSSTNTVFQVQKSSPVMGHATQADTASYQKTRNESYEVHGKSTGTPPGNRKQSFDPPRTPPAKAEETSVTSSSESDSEPEAEAPMTRSRAYTRRPRYSSSKAPLGALSDADEESEDSPLFLPFSDTRGVGKPATQQADPSATLRVPPKQQAPRPLVPKADVKARHLPKSPQTIHSSSSSAQSQPARPPKAPLSSLSPRQQRLAKEGSEGTPSMGSSFSDLDDASVTQSALEEALANEMAHGGVASRMSSISQALKSRYL